MKLRPVRARPDRGPGSPGWAYGACRRLDVPTLPTVTAPTVEPPPLPAPSLPGPTLPAPTVPARADRHDAALAPRTHADVAHDELVVHAGADPSSPSRR